MKRHDFGPEDPLADLGSPQAQYLRCYLSDLGAAHVLEEEQYFDRDYLEEHSAYYGSIAARYPSTCRRLHFFTGGFSEGLLLRALGGDPSAASLIQESFLGFVVVRPLPHAPLGRSVVRWYPDEKERYAGNPRIVAPSRKYTVHIAGLALQVSGLAWQQQDGAVALCATTALWSMLHSSAFDDHHAVPTTTTVTRFAYRSLREGAHVFPATDGMDNRQVVEAIARAQLTPILIEGDVGTGGFSRTVFSTTCAAMIRSGYPVLLSGRLQDGSGGHMVCLTGFRETGPFADSPFQDAGLNHLYVHDDNLGPNVRHEIGVDADEHDCVVLRPSAPEPRYPEPRLFDPASGHVAFVPEQIIVGVHEGLHMSPQALKEIAQRVADALQDQVEEELNLATTFRFAKVASYLRNILPRDLPQRHSGSCA